MSVLDGLIKAMDEVLGFPEDELREDLELNLLEEGLIDSLALVTLISNIEKYIGYSVDIKNMDPSAFENVLTIAKALEEQK